MKPANLLLFAVLPLLLSACGSSNPPVSAKKRPSAHTASAVKPVRIRHIDQHSGGQELMLHAMDLVGTPYRWGGSSDSGFDCSGMIQFVYKNALNVNLPRTSRDMAAASRNIGKKQLKTGDLVFFNTSGKGISHVGLYLGNGDFLHAPRSGSSVKTEKLDHPYYAKRFVKAGSFF
ncbi:MAG: C40 family peptidase [Neisseria sp.]|nr:C40 family peptidase [Neisseria sp.]